ncbi:MAG: undecaprenyldiphospho-muramoylpentapeptide beta-N-acetylglucosaminyltransferase [Chloroherpetonaceae bacterium]|nr:undecaprenyldiphospho-muramoylpentapeptide beta-N-acetylglucosaminyltransferase [Chthonomonadaceae bacterium]MDW8208442.1 undecaprenyldiphospho-muramoylpentapeptide beta-N-acetylglucosaminyltransferase [Chloroherpetonaceae bacterium]
MAGQGVRVVVSGGGTGGHIFPAIAVAESLQRIANAETLYIGGTSGMETQIVPREGLMYQAVTARKLRRVISLSTIGVVASLLRGYAQAKACLKAFRAQAVVGTGGYVAAATVLAGARLGLPVIILEGNAIAGRTNRLQARFARWICVAFQETLAQFPGGRAVQTGLPLRAGIVLPPEVNARQARCALPGLSPDRFTLLVLGGSQGARGINLRVLDAAPRLLQVGVQILHQTGRANEAEVRAIAQARGLEAQSGYVPLPFLEHNQISLALRAADLIVCRGGISTLSEVMVNGLPALIVPLPTAYADHQTHNARVLERAGAALLCPERDLTGESLTEMVLELRDAPHRRAQMAGAMRAMGRPHAADHVARLVLNTL